MKKTVCILTAGRGTRMGPYASYINKALLPINKKAIITHIIEKFPKGTEFVIAVGYLSDQVKNFLAIAHPAENILFVEVDNYIGPGSGPGYSLLSCKHLLNKPFYFVSCDTLWEGETSVDLEQNWVGVSRIDEANSAGYCNFKIKDNQVVSIHDKIKVKGEDYKGFIGLCYIRDYNVFWDGLGSSELISGEHQISNGICALVKERTVKQCEVKWADVGTLENYKKAVSNYEKYDFSKTNEFIYMQGGLIIKFFTDQNVVDRRVAKAKLNPEVFPEITEQRGQFYGYRFMPGQTLYEKNSSDMFKALLKWLDQNLWVEAKVPTEDMRRICKTFYYEKTLERLSLYNKKYKGADTENVINGVKVPAVSDLIRQFPWENIFSGEPMFFHGDLQFDNIIYTKQNSFVLLDWRQDFGGHIEFGDLYYDLAKLYGGIILNYDFIKNNLINYSEEGSIINFDFAQRFSSKVYLAELNHFIRERGWDEQKVRMLVPLIYLNMSPLHHYPFDKMLYALGRLMLTEELKGIRGIEI